MDASPGSESSTGQVAAIYGVVFLSLVLVGALVRTPVLNWLVGPAWVVVGVALLSRLRLRRPRSER